MARFSLSAVGADRPGIVAAVTAALADAGCNLQDSTMAILQGQFAIMLVLDASDDTTDADLQVAVAPAASALELTVSVRPLPPPPAPTGTGAEPDAEPWVLSIHGADRPGIVAAVTAALADAGGNIVDLVTHVVGPADAPVYTMTVRATLPAASAAAGAERIRAAAARLGVHCAVHRDDADLL